MSKEDKRRKSKEIVINEVELREHSYNYRVANALQIKDPEERVNSLQKIEENILDDRLKKKISESYKKDKLAFVRSVIKRTEKELANSENQVNTQRIIDLAIKPLNLKDKAQKFMWIYSEQRELNPHYNPTEFVNEIGWPSPSSNTQKDWMEKFDEAERMLSNSNS